MKREIIAVLDPMCSWCWGFEPVLEELQRILPEDVKLSVLMGGLRTKGDQPWTREFRTYLKEHWENVEAVTGQPFDKSFLDRAHFEYDTEPACRAVVTLREIDETKVFAFVCALQKAFYCEGKEINTKEVILNVLRDVDVDRDMFLKKFESEALRQKTQEDFYKARSMGASAFPSLVFIDEEGHLCVVKGYRSIEKIRAYID